MAYQSHQKAAPNVLPTQVLAQRGLGEIGKNGLFLTPEFGPRQRFAMLLTDAELEPDKPFEPYLCKNCNACIDACPLEAFSKTDKAKVGFEKLASTIPVRNNTMCTRCKNGAIQTNEGRFNTVERSQLNAGALASRHLRKGDSPRKSSIFRSVKRLLGPRISSARRPTSSKLQTRKR